MVAITEENFGCYLFLYRTEVFPKNISMQRFCMRNSIKYDEFFLWYKKTQQKIEPVVVVGEPEPPCQEPGDPYLNMNRDELVSQIRFLLKLQEDKDAIIDRQ